MSEQGFQPTYDNAIAFLRERDIDQDPVKVVEAEVSELRALLAVFEAREPLVRRLAGAIEDTLGDKCPEWRSLVSWEMDFGCPLPNVQPSNVPEDDGAVDGSEVDAALAFAEQAGWAEMKKADVLFLAQLAAEAVAIGVITYVTGEMSFGEQSAPLPACLVTIALFFGVPTFWGRVAWWRLGSRFPAFAAVAKYVQETCESGVAYAVVLAIFGGFIYFMSRAVIEVFKTNPIPTTIGGGAIVVAVAIAIFRAKGSANGPAE